ncbi:MAG: beta-lactamase family protein [Myxococcales bacterium]|nr:beta-lactamase family protein [Myxococcales bacterium]
MRRPTPSTARRAPAVALAAVLLTACGAAPATPPATRHGLPVLDAPPAALDAAALAHLVARAEAEHSTGLIVLHDGRIVVESYFGADPQTASMAMSVTKSVVALGIGALVDAGHLDLDEPLAARLVPEWAGTDKATLTTRHLLNHTSGLPLERYGAGGEGDAAWRTRTIEAHVLGAALVTPPGAAFAYNNDAVDFLSVVARRAEPERLYLDDTLQRLVFGPLGVTGAFWSKDGRGDPRGGGELIIRPIDLAKIGQLVLDRGVWQGRRVLSAAWIDQMLAPGQPLTDQCGLLWWRDGRAKAHVLTEARLKRWTERGVDAAHVEAARPLLGQRFDTLQAARVALARRVGDDALLAIEAKMKPVWLFERDTEVLAYRADGWLGQYVVVVPSKRLVAVRTRDPRRTSWNPDEFGYPDFRWDVLAVAGLTVPPAER